MSVRYHISRVVRFFCGKIRPRTCAIIVAAGSGKRMGEQVAPKQFLTLDGIPVLAHTMMAFEKCKYIDEIIVVAQKEHSALVRSIAGDYNIKKLSHIVQGGNERSESVLNGMTAVGEKTGFVAIHDAARCLITPDQISAVVSAAYAYSAASAGAPVKDTVKRVGANGFIIETPPRTEMWNASTPQVFNAAMYRAAAISACKEKLSCTDDNMIMEHIGQRVKMVDVGYENIKLTTPEDLVAMEAIIKNRKIRAEENIKKKKSHKMQKKG